MNVASGGTFPNVNYAPAANAAVVFSCGCSPQAGSGNTDGAGYFVLPQTSNATPSGTYTIVPGRNYVIIATTGSKAEAWTLEFAGSQPARDLVLNSSAPSTASGASDVYTAAATLYVYFASPGGSATAYDGWNFNTVEAWTAQLRNAPNAAETTLLRDIMQAQQSGATLYPIKPPWNASQTTNPTLYSDLQAVQSSGDSALPTPCPGGESGCTGTPSP
jgi:hypothetical protein